VNDLTFGWVYFSMGLYPWKNRLGYVLYRRYEKLHNVKDLLSTSALGVFLGFFLMRCQDFPNIGIREQRRSWPGGPDPPGTIRWTPEICTNSMRKFWGVPRVPSAVEFSAPTAPRLSGPPSHKNPATPLFVNHPSLSLNVLLFVSVISLKYCICSCLFS
jgi:hypothetical protein